MQVLISVDILNVINNEDNSQNIDALGKRSFTTFHLGISEKFIGISGE